MKYLPLFLFVVLAGCATQPTVKSWLDPVSSATITAQIEPLVLACVEPTNQIDKRDYAQLTAIEVNRMGDRQLYLLAILWSTADVSSNQRQTLESSFARVEVSLGDRVLALTRYPGDIAELGIGQAPLPIPIPGSQHIYFPIERAALRAMSQSASLKLTALGVTDAPQRYEEWKDGRQGLSDFLGQLPEESPGRSGS